MKRRIPYTKAERRAYQKVGRPRRMPSVLPPDVAKMDDILWEPSFEEKQLVRLRNLKRQWEVEDFETLKRRAAKIAAVIKQDREWLARLAERQEQIREEQKRVTDYWLAERQKQAEADHKVLLARLAKATKEIQRSDARSEREELLRRGVVRGRRNASSSSMR